MQAGFFLILGPGGWVPAHSGPRPKMAQKPSAAGKFFDRFDTNARGKNTICACPRRDPPPGVPTSLGAWAPPPPGLKRSLFASSFFGGGEQLLNS